MQKKITIVEDDPDILFTLSVMLTNAGYSVEQLSTGATIMDDTCECPDLFILDKRMPDMDGLDVCRHIRETAISTATPVIIISASPRFGPQAIRAGANDFLEKPFQMKTLLAMVKRYLDSQPIDGQL
jgi:DNA-binding response OmpR family regulator